MILDVIFINLVEVKMFKYKITLVIQKWRYLPCTVTADKNLSFLFRFSPSANFFRLFLASWSAVEAKQDAEEEPWGAG